MLTTSLPKIPVRNLLRTVLFLVLSIFYSQHALAAEQPSGDAPQLAIINMDNAQFTKGFEDMKDLLNTADFDPNKVRILGAADAPLTLWDISAYSCPHCANFHKDALPEIFNKYIETGKLRIAFMNTAFDELTAYFTAATYAAQNMEQFLAFSNMIYADQNKWYSQNYQAELNRMLAANGISQDQLAKTLESEQLNKNLPRIFEYISEGLQVKGTPHFILTETGNAPEQAIGSVEGNDKKAVLTLIEKGLAQITE